MKRKILQYLADYIIKSLETAPNEKAFYFYIEMGTWLDTYAIAYHDIYLD